MCFHFFRMVSSRFSQSLAILLLAAVFAASGCQKETQPEREAGPDEPIAPEPLVALVVGEPDIGDEIARQWLAQANGELEIRNISTAEFSSRDFEVDSEIDVIIYPVWMLGELQSRKRIQEFSRRFWQSGEFNKDDLLRLYRTTWVRHQNEHWGVPLGGPSLMLVFSQPWADGLKSPVPNDWQKLVEQFGNSASGSLSLKLPLAKGSAVNIFLARSSAEIRNRGRISTVFDRDTMEPLIHQAPFVQSLQDLKTLMGDDLSQLELTPLDVYQQILSGDCKIGIASPRAVESDDGIAASGIDLGFQLLPGSQRWYDGKSGRWMQRAKTEPHQFDLVGFDGLMASVASQAHSTEDCADFLIWLSSKSTVFKTFVNSPRSGPFRKSHLALPAAWCGDQLSDPSLRRYTDAVDAGNEQDVQFMFPRIPGQQRYLELLDDNIRECLNGNLEPQAALERTTQQWNELTHELGIERMIKELAKSGGL